jgi:GDPmannose 4,6-dehydratase
MSSVGMSWQHPEVAEAVNGAAPRDLLEVLRSFPDVRFLQAASAEERGDATDSPYAQGKLVAHQATTTARDEGRFACAAVLHIHESPVRGAQFVSRKITRAAAAISLGRQDRLALGRLDVRRDWGAAVDHVRAMRLMLRADEPRDLEVCTGRSQSLRDLVEVAFGAAGIDDPWSVIDHDPALARPSDSADLVGDPVGAATHLGWSPAHSFCETITTMVRIDLLRLTSGVDEDESYLTATSPARS